MKSAAIRNKKKFTTNIPLTRSISSALTTSSKGLDEYFLANRTIASSRISSLLVSASFGANSILYAAWLGYIMGFWSLLIHVAWCLSFVLLAKFAPVIYQYTSLHDFLGCRFGRVTQIVASICSIIGLLYFAGWEIAIAKSGIESLLLSAGIDIGLGLPMVVSITLLFAVLYTSIGGKRANGYVDFTLNIIKFVLLGGVVFTLGKGILMSPNSDYTVLFPSLSSAIGSIGIIGFITNMLFNVSWQFIDNSSWQSVSSGDKNEKNIANKSIICASKGVFISYILSTTLGVFLRGIPDLNSNNILSGVIFSDVVGIGTMVSLVVLLLLSMLSLFDNIGLSVAQSLLVDLKLGEKFDRFNSYVVARLLTVVVGIFAAWGVHLVLAVLGKSIFEFVYIFIVAQLSLLGAVLMGLIFKKTNSKFIWISIFIGIANGISASILGGLFEIAVFSEAAGAISAVSSVIVALLLTYIEYICNKNKCTRNVW